GRGLVQPLERTLWLARRARIQRRQHSAQNVDLVLVRLRSMEDSPKLQPELPRMISLEEAGRGQDLFEMAMETFELLSRREALHLAFAGPDVLKSGVCHA